MPHFEYKKYLSYFLILMGIHSFSVGTMLIFIPPTTLNFFGFPDYKESFFQAQGGVFHIALCIAYFMAGLNPAKSIRLIKFIAAVKFIAATFLIIYFLFVLPAWLILLSGISDGMMGLIVLILFRRSGLGAIEHERSF
jgi:hypothetical protein